MWIATLPESAGQDLATVLKATGLDPLGIDQTLLLRRLITHHSLKPDGVKKQLACIRLAGMAQLQNDSIGTFSACQGLLEFMETAELTATRCGAGVTDTFIALMSNLLLSRGLTSVTLPVGDKNADESSDSDDD